MSPRTPPHTSRILVAILTAAACAACQPSPAPSVDLLQQFAQAERRGAPDAIRTDFASAGGETRASLVIHATARVVWRVRFPARARLRTSVALVPDASGALGGGAVARVGLSDGRRYETLRQVRLDRPADGRTSWQQVDVDLGPYSGWQWSLFYRPSRMEWQLILAADAAPGGTIAWGQPVIVMSN